MWTDNKKAISEVNKILKQLNETSLNKVPKKLLDEIEKNSTVNVDYIKSNIALEDLQLEEETKEMLAVISYNYFCNDKERENWNKELKENELKYQDKLKKKYNTENIFKSNVIINKKELNTIETKEENSLIEYKESFFKKIWNIIKKIWNRTN